jgi:hypothetical protein
MARKGIILAGGAAGARRHSLPLLRQGSGALWHGAFCRRGLRAGHRSADPVIGTRGGKKLCETIVPLVQKLGAFMGLSSSLVGAREHVKKWRQP